MRKWIMVLALCGLLAQFASADVWDDLAQYRYGADPDTATEAFELLSETAIDQVASIEKKLIRVLSDRKATEDGKVFACRLLQRIGTDRSVPALSGLLDHDVLSDYARLALERMRDSAPAGDALRNALKSAPEKLKVGIIGSIGERRDAAALEPLAQLAAGDSRAVAAAAILALGKIGGPEAATRLGNLKVAGDLNEARLDALIVCARQLEAAAAASLYKKALAAKSEEHRIAALVGLANVEPDAGAKALLVALRGADERMRAGALSAVAEVKGEKLTQMLLPVLDEFKGERLAVLIRAFGSRGDAAALGEVVERVGSPDPAVRDAAIAAAGRLGDGATAALLLRLADADEAGGAVRTALTRMPGADVDEALIHALTEPGLRRAAIPVLGARGCTAATPKLLELAKDAQSGARDQVWAALAVLADQKDLNDILQAAVAITDTNELANALETINKVFARAADKPAGFKIISSHYGKAQAALKEAMLPLGAAAGDGHALNLMRTALQSGSPELYRRAVRALAAWPNGLAEKELLNLARNAPEEVDRIVALQGLIRIAGLETVGLSDKQRLGMLKAAMDLAKRPQEKKLIAHALQGVTSFAALDLLSAYREDPDMAAEAELAAARILWPLRTNDVDRAWTEAYELRRSRNRTVTDMANKTLGDLAESRREWRISEVYSGAQTRKLFDRAFPPEKGTKDVRWNVWTRDDGIPAAETAESRCMYLETRLHADKKQTAHIEIRTDAAVKVWYNGSLVHEKYPERPRKTSADGLELEPEKDLPETLVTAVRTEGMKVDLEEGESLLLVKLVTESAEPVFTCALRKPQGLPVSAPEQPEPRPRDVDPYMGLYEGVYEHDGKVIGAEARVTTLGPDAPYRATVFVNPESTDYRFFWIWSGDIFDELEVYTDKDGKTKGVNYAYYAGNDFKFDFENREAAKTGTLPYFSLEPKETDRSFGFMFTGFVKIPSDGRYRFFLGSDDGSRLSIDGNVIVENRVWQKSGAAELKAGMHPIRVDYFQHIGNIKLNVGCLKQTEEEEKQITLKGEGLDTVWEGRLLPDELVLTPQDPEKGRFVLKYVDRQSPTAGLEPPEGATVLLRKADDGGPPSIREWTNKTWIPLPDGSMRVGKKNTFTFKEFGDHRLHLEFMCPFEPNNLGQGRGNSGVYVQGRYELQVLDAFGFDPGRSTCGAVYYLEPIQRPATLPPLTWQTYDAVFRAARFNADGEIVKNPVYEVVKLNGRVVHENLELPAPTYGGFRGPHQKTGPILLQDHGNKVRYRNIWVEPLEDAGDR